MTRDELLALIATGREPGDDGIPANFFEDVIAGVNALGDENDSLRSGSEARFAELTGANEKMAAEMAELKARNYDLLMASSADDSGGAESKREIIDDAPQGIDSLFG